MGRRQRNCWVCGQVGCHSRNHPPEEQAPNQQQQFREPCVTATPGWPVEQQCSGTGKQFPGPADGRADPVASSPSLSVRPTLTSSGSKRNANTLLSNDPTIAYFLDDNDMSNAPSMLNLPIFVLPEWKSPRVNMKIEGETLPVLLDTGAEISTMPKKIMEKFVDCSTLNTHRRCQTFGGYVLRIEGPCYLNVEICGYKPVSYTHLTLPTILRV